MATAAKLLENRTIISRHSRQKLWLPILFLLPAGLFLLGFTAIPLIQAIVLSFERWNGIQEATWVGLRNYQLLLEDEAFRLAVFNTIYYTVATMLFHITVPLVVANILNSGLRGSTIFRFIYFLPVIISLTITGLLWSMIFEPNFGLLNETLRSLGLGSLAKLWLADRTLVMPSIIVVSVWQSLGFYMMIFFAAMQSIPEDLYEAASIDGANSWKRFRFVTVPMLRNTIIVVIVLSTIGGIKSFDQIWVMTGGGPNHASETLGTYLYRTAFGTLGSSNPQLGYATAIAMVILVLGLIFSVIQIRVGRNREVEM